MTYCTSFTHLRIEYNTLEPLFLALCVLTHLKSETILMLKVRLKSDIPNTCVKLVYVYPIVIG